MIEEWTINETKKKKRKKKKDNLKINVNEKKKREWNFKSIKRIMNIAASYK